MLRQSHSQLIINVTFDGCCLPLYPKVFICRDRHVTDDKKKIYFTVFPIGGQRVHINDCNDLVKGKRQRQPHHIPHHIYTDDGL